MTRRPADSRVRTARRLGSTKETRALYRDWAADYDRDIAEELQFTGSGDIARLLADHLSDTAARIIDLGCGTGLVAAELQALGFTELDGLDLSPEMLEMARAKGIYRHLIEADLTQPLAFSDATYDAAISAGTFTTGHVDSGALGEILRIVKPGGVMACVIACDYWDTGGFAGTLEDLQTSGRIAMAHHSIRPIARTGTSEAHFCVIRLRPEQL